MLNSSIFLSLNFILNITFLAELEVTEKPIDIDDFEEVIDAKTGVKVLRLKVDVAQRAGMMELLDAEFETYVDPTTGKQSIRVKQTEGAGSTGT